MTIGPVSCALGVLLMWAKIYSILSSSRAAISSFWKPWSSYLWIVDRLSKAFCAVTPSSRTPYFSWDWPFSRCSEIFTDR